MTINSNWLEKDFKQKYFLFCREKELKQKITLEKFAQTNNKSYISRIKIQDL